MLCICCTYVVYMLYICHLNMLCTCCTYVISTCCEYNIHMSSQHGRLWFCRASKSLHYSRMDSRIDKKTGWLVMWKVVSLNFNRAKQMTSKMYACHDLAWHSALLNTGLFGFRVLQLSRVLCNCAKSMVFLWGCAITFPSVRFLFS